MKNTFFKCMLRYSPYFIVELMLAYILARIVVQGNDIIAAAVDGLAAGQAVEFELFIGRLLMLTAAGFAVAFVKSVCTSKYSIKVQTRYKSLVAEKLYRLEYKYFDKNGSASVINKMNSDIAEADAFLNENLPYICTDGVAAITYAVYIGQLNVKLLLVMLLCYPAVLISSNYIVKKIINLKKGHREKADVITEIAQDCVSGILVLRAFGAEKYFQNKINEAADAVVNFEESRTRISNNVIITRRILQWLPNIICAVYAYVLVLHGTISIGGLMAFVIILTRFVESFVGLPYDLVEAKEHMVCIHRVEEILRGTDERSGEEVTGLDGTVAVAFEDVTFGYNEERPVLKHLSFSIPSGTKAAFVGDSGGGKSTIFHLLCGFYNIDSGKYTLFGREFKQWNVEAARQNMALVSQNAFLFPATIEENVAYGNEKATKEEIIEACKKARIHDFIMSLPEKYDTMVGERGILLSGGERQRISIARAFLKNAPVLLLDEPTSAVDVDTEKLIQEAIDSLAENRTCIIIAHRLSTVRNVDCIMVLKDGAVVEQGTHRELLAGGGVYAGMYGKEEER